MVSYIILTYINIYLRLIHYIFIILVVYNGRLGCGLRNKYWGAYGPTHLDFTLLIHDRVDLIINHSTSSLRL